MSFWRLLKLVGTLCCLALIAIALLVHGGTARPPQQTIEPAPKAPSGLRPDFSRSDK